MNKMAQSNRGKDALGVQPAHECAWHGNAFKRQGLGQSASNPKLIEQLEAENSQLRGRLMDLMLQIQALRDALARPQSATAGRYENTTRKGRGFPSAARRA
jgi:hypothetical protein